MATRHVTVAEYGSVLIEAVLPQDTNTETKYMVSCAHRCDFFGAVAIPTRAEADDYALTHAREQHGYRG